MQHLANLLLHVAIEVDHEIAAGDEVDARERRIAQHAVEREHHEVAHLAPDAEPVAVAHEERVSRSSLTSAAIAAG